MNWKVIAIIFIVLFTLETCFLVWSFVSYSQYEEEQNECFFDFCSGYPDASYLDGGCTCYDIDDLGYLIVAKEKYLG